MTLPLLSAAALPVLRVLAEQRPADEDVTAGPLGFFVFIALAAAVTLLYFSLRKQLKRVDFVEEPERPGRGSQSRRAPGSARSSDPAGGPVRPEDGTDPEPPGRA